METLLELMGQPAPNFSLTDLNGNAVSLAQWRGKPVLLNFFKSTCPWNQAEMPKLGEVYRRHADLEVQVFGVVVGKDDETSAARFAAEKGLDFPLAVDTQKTVRELYPLRRVPTLVLIDAAGNIQRVYEGASEQLAGIVEQTLLAAARGDQPPDYYLVGSG